MVRVRVIPFFTIELHVDRLTDWSNDCFTDRSVRLIEQFIHDHNVISLLEGPSCVCDTCVYYSKSCPNIISLCHKMYVFSWRLSVETALLVTGKAMMTSVASSEWDVSRTRYGRPGWDGLGMYEVEKRRSIVSKEFWRQMFVHNEAGEDRKRWIDVVKYNVEDLGLDFMDVENRASWRQRTCVADPSPEGSTAWRRKRRVHVVNVFVCDFVQWIVCKHPQCQTVRYAPFHTHRVNPSTPRWSNYLFLFWIFLVVLCSDSYRLHYVFCSFVWIVHALTKRLSFPSTFFARFFPHFLGWGGGFPQLIQLRGLKSIIKFLQSSPHRFWDIRGLKCALDSKLEQRLI